MKTPHADRAEILIHQQKFNLAESELRKALSHDVDNSWLHSKLGVTLYNLNRYAEALDEANIALSLNPENGHAHYVMSLALEGLQNYKEAKKAILEAIRINPSIPLYHFIAGNIFLIQQDYNKAIISANSGLALNPNDINCLNLLAIAESSLGRHQSADKIMRRSLEIAPESAATHTNYGRILSKKGDHGRALDHFRNSLRINPEIKSAQTGLENSLRANKWIYKAINNEGSFEDKILYWIASSFLLIFITLLPFHLPFIAIFFYQQYFKDIIVDMFFRLNPKERYLLSQERIKKVDGFISAILFSLFMITGAEYNLNPAPYYYGIFGLALLYPVTGVNLKTSASWYKIFLYWGGIALLTILAVLLATSEPEIESRLMIAAMVFGLSFLIFSLAYYNWD